MRSEHHLTPLAGSMPLTPTAPPVSWWLSAPPLPRVPGGFPVILADPPWHHASNSTWAPGRNPRRHYGCLKLQDLCDLPVREIAADNAIRFLWVPWPQLVIGRHIPLMESWGFEASAHAFLWLKLRLKADPIHYNLPRDLHFGCGHTTRKNSEPVIIGKRGRIDRLRQDFAVPEVIIAPRREHSRKPDELYHRIERYAGDVPRIELFARQTWPGWVSWGNEVTKYDLAAEESRT